MPLFSMSASSARIPELWEAILDTVEFFTSGVPHQATDGVPEFAGRWSSTARVVVASSIRRSW
jgi:hypothetical protein